MKHLFVLILFSLILSACAGSSAPLGGSCREGLMCIKLQVIEPVLFNQPVNVTITVTALKDIPRLGVSLSAVPSNVVVEGPQGWEQNVIDPIVWEGGAGWLVNAKGNLPLLFVRTIRFPPSEGIFLLVARAGIETGASVEDSVQIYITSTGGIVYYSGTSIPITPGPAPTMPPALRTLLAQPTPTRTPSPVPTPTRAPYP